MNISITCLLALAITQMAAAPSPFGFRQIGATGLELSEGGKAVFVYNYGLILAPGFPETMRRSSYLHPVYAPDGTVLTDDFNADHPHHRGISWMWPEVTVGGKKGDLWTVKGFQQRFIRWGARQAGTDTARLVVRSGWFDGDRKFVDEEVEIVAHAASAGRRLLEFTLHLAATDRPVEIAGTSEGGKGFGGFCMRFAPRDGGAAKTIIRTEQGIAAADGVMAQHAWAEITGTFHGRPAGARLEDDAANPGCPHNGWLLRHGFGFLNVSYPGRKPLTLEPGKALVLKYRVLLLSGASAAAAAGGSAQPAPSRPRGG